MADERSKNGEGSGLNRRGFIKSAGVVVAGDTRASGLTTLPRSRAAAQRKRRRRRLTNSRCPICAKDFSTFGESRNHFAAAHPGDVLPVPPSLR